MRTAALRIARATIATSAGAWIRALAARELQVLRRDRIRQEERDAVVEVDPLFPRIECTHGQDREVVRRAARRFERVVGAQREVQVTTPARAQPVTQCALRVGARDTDEQELGRLARLASLDVDRVTVERADDVVLDLVSDAIARFDRVADVVGLDRLAQPLVQRVHDVLHGRVAVLVELEIELLRLVAQHVGEGASDAFDQGRVRHG